MRRTIACVSMLVTLLVVLHDCSSASAQTVVINAVNRGWYTDEGTHGGGFSSTANYFAGDANEFFEREYRNFFFFDLTGVSQPIASAKLVLSNGHYDSLDLTENYELYDVTTPPALILAGGILVPAYTDFGSGVVYGSRTMAFEAFVFQAEIELNSSAIAAMNATHGLFGIGGSVTTLDSVRNLEGVFGFTGSSQFVSQLQLTLVPEPSTLLLLGIGAISLLGYRKRTR